MTICCEAVPCRLLLAHSPINLPCLCGTNGGNHGVLGICPLTMNLIWAPTKRSVIQAQSLFLGLHNRELLSAGACIHALCRLTHFLKSFAAFCAALAIRTRLAIRHIFAWPHWWWWRWWRWWWWRWTWRRRRRRRQRCCASATTTLQKDSDACKNSARKRPRG